MAGEQPLVVTSAGPARVAAALGRSERHRIRWLSAAVLLMYCVAVAAVAMSLFGRHAYDDPYITYRYAQNLLRGNGLVYNLGERTLSTTSPLYAGMLAALGLFSPNLPLLSNAVGALSIAIGGWLLWRLSRAWDGVGLAMVLLLYPLTPILYQALGSELPLVMALCLGCYAAYVEGRFKTAALCAALAVLTRGDAGILVALLAIDHWLLRRRPIPWAAAAVFCGIVGAWVAFATAYYGSPIPATLTAKRLQGDMAISQSFAGGLTSLVSGYLHSWVYWLEAALLAVGFGLAVGSKRDWRLFLAWPLMYALAYAALGVPRYFWYYVTLAPATVLLLALTMRSIFRRAHQEWGMGAGLLLTLALVATIAAGHWAQMAKLATPQEPRAAVYRAAGEWLAANTPADASVGALEVGIVGYYGGRSMVDFAGLVQPEVAGHFTATSTYEDAARWAIEAYAPDYVVLERSRMPGLAAEVADRCQTVAHFIGAGDTILAIYRCSASR